jgi:uncharacterized integral membrane protein
MAAWPHGEGDGPAVPAQAQLPGRPPAGAGGKLTRTGGAWIAFAVSAVVLLLLLIFILENRREVDIAYFGAHAHMPLGVALLLAAVLGGLLVAIPAGARILQQRRGVRKQARATAKNAKRTQTATPETPPEAAGPALMAMSDNSEGRST